MSRSGRVATVVIALTAGLLALVAPAAAARTPDATPLRIEIPMQVTGFDPAVAAANGYPTLMPAGVVGGPCGSSYLFLDAGVQTMTIRTGFSIIPSKPPAQYVSWRVNLRKSTGGGFMVPWSEPVNSGGVAKPSWTWDSVKQRTNIAAGHYEGIVTIAAAQLVGGEICTSGHPTASINVVNP